MQVLFIGGPLDGELREVLHSTGIVLDPPLTAGGPRPERYHLANGIGRHESVAEEEVARRVYMALNTGVQE